MSNRLLLCSLLCPFLGIVEARAALTPNPLFTDNMVLQENMPVPVWGTGDDGNTVTVTFGGRAVAAPVTIGHWKAVLPALPMSHDPRILTISDGKTTIAAKDVLVGEVWLCSGQSNMERQLGPRAGQPEIDNWKAEAAAANYPEIRQYYVTQTHGPIDTPLETVPGSWSVCIPQTAVNFAAVGYFFARDREKTLNVPIGIIHSSLGGTPIKSWSSHASLLADPDVKNIAERDNQAVQRYQAALAEYQANEATALDRYNIDVVTARQQGKPAPKKPEPPRNPADDGFPSFRSSILYNGMIAPLQPYAIRGVVWYQGESDAGHAKVYRILFPKLIADWRKGWGEGDFPFLFVQIAPSRNWDPAIREAQLLTWQMTPGIAMVVTTDIGSTNAHPPHKQLVGERLALAARGIVDGEKIEYSGPVYDTVDFKGPNAILHFTHVGGGLVAKNGDLKGFEISGDGKTFVLASAAIDGETVIVTSTQVSIPNAVRYGWSPTPDVNLFNQDGLPASPFQTNPD